MMEKLSAKEFDYNYKYILERAENAAVKSGRSLSDIIILAATKTVDVDTVNYAITSGITYIGENRVQELLSKNSFLKDTHKHFIGSLQTNKVKDVVPIVEMIQSVDSLKLASEISKQAVKFNKTMEILVEVNIAGEVTKSGFSPEETADNIYSICNLPNILVKGLMSIPPVCENDESNRKFFMNMYKLFIDIRDKKIDNSNMQILSMGMSDDFETAISEGANMIRLGTALFGKRNYNYKGV